MGQVSDTATQVRQWTATQEYRDNLKLIPPLAEEFTLYGGDDTVERAREWALGNRYLLADGIPPCAHGLYLMRRCPGEARSRSCRAWFRQLDHARIWVPAMRSQSSDGETHLLRPFLLAHPYSKGVAAETRTYAEAHGLEAGTLPGDDWYGSGALPIRLTIQSAQWWPIEARAASILAYWGGISWPAGEADAPEYQLPPEIEAVIEEGRRHPERRTPYRRRTPR